jgi:phage terminase small subunit
MKESTFKKYCLVVDEWFINGFNGTKAYQKYYPESDYESADASFRKILENTRIKEYKESKQNKTSSTLQITLERQILELEDLKKLSKEDNKFNDAINALKEQSKLLGFYEKDNNQKKTEINISDLTTEELIKRASLLNKLES